MARIRRGGYIFLTWIGDHSPRHVHVYRDGKLIVKWDLENKVPMEGEASRRICVSSKNWKRRDFYENQIRQSEQSTKGV